VEETARGSSLTSEAEGCCWPGCTKEIGLNNNEGLLGLWASCWNKGRQAGRKNIKAGIIS